MRGSSEPAGQSTTTCGSERMTALARSSSSRSRVISSRDQASNRAMRVRARTSMIAVTTANKTTPKTSARNAISCWSMLRCAVSTSSCSASAGCSAAAAGNDAHGDDRRQGSADPPRAPPMRIAPAGPDRVRHAPLPLLAAAISPAPACPRPQAGQRKSGETRESDDFTLKRNRAERVQIVNVGALAVRAARRLDPACSEPARRAPCLRH